MPTRGCVLSRLWRFYATHLRFRQKRVLAKEPRSGGKTIAQGKRGRQAKAQPWVKHPPEHAAPAGRQKMFFHEEHGIATKCKSNFVTTP